MRRLFCVAAFSNTPQSGNPAGVCILTEPMDSEAMQNLAKEMSFSEISFAEKLGVDRYRLRIFAPRKEVDLCGHATLATAHILWETGNVLTESIIFETRSGELKAFKRDTRIRVDLPLSKPIVAIPPDGMLGALGLAHFTEAFKGADDYVFVIDEEKALEKLSPDFASISKIRCRGVAITAPANDINTDFVSRCFYPSLGINEDPVTGSAHCILGPYWANRLGKNNLLARQISERGGSMEVEVTNTQVYLTSSAVTMWEGTIKG
jgi:PhzF family phenazine biosynthesis protein